MRRPQLLLLACIPAILIIACKQNTKQPDTTPVVTPARQEKPEMILYAATVDKLNLRDQPNRNGKVLTQVAEGTLLEGTGESSDIKEEVILRGISYNEPYLKISAVAGAPQAGWAYGAALQPVYSGKRDDGPDQGKITQLTALLNSLDTKEMSSGKKAWDFVITAFSNEKNATADAAFILLQQFLFRMEREGEYYVQTEKIKWTDEDFQAVSDGKFDLNKYPLTRKLAENGFSLAMGEGMIFPVVDWRRLRDFFAPRASPGMKSYIDQELIEETEQVWDDGGIIVSLEDLADRAVFWEKFSNEHPYFPLIGQVKESARWMRLVLVNGADNTPSFNYEDQSIAPDFRKVWAYITQKYPGTELAKVCEEISGLCAAEGWKRTKKVEDWQTAFANRYE